ncbi:hypothetical protein CCE02nite_15210 [Cellulosimicrobium cellulans]|uniref:Uncharacterized protein n=1 Tax=Cellulosimicrobium cellulans TaxID=1710 RepID=A0A4Y4DVU0_CELCE|nr:hypothetical protein CCE02nite_15210 [Cellulosimicrobium cellulans]
MDRGIHRTADAPEAARGEDWRHGVGLRRRRPPEATVTTPSPARDAAFPEQLPEKFPDRSSEQPSARAAARGLHFTARPGRGARRRTVRPAPRPDVPPVERANGWLVAVAVVAGAVLFSVLAMNAFLGG